MSPEGGAGAQEVVVVAVRDDDAAYKALLWTLDQFHNDGGYEGSQLFILLHVISDVVNFEGRKVQVGDASQQEVAEHVCETVLPFLETLQDICDEREATSSIEVVKSANVVESICGAAGRLRASKLVLAASGNSTPDGTLAGALQPENQPPGCAVFVVRDGVLVQEFEAKGQLLPLVHTGADGWNSSVLGLVENPDFRSTSESGESNREKWQKKQAMRSGVLQPRTDLDFPDAKAKPNGVSSSKGAGGGAGSEDDGMSALQMARMAYRQVNNQKDANAGSDSENGSLELAQGDSGEGAGGGGPVELALPPPSVTRSSKMSGKLLASQKLMSGKLRDGSAKPAMPKGVKLDPKVREQKEQQASNSIRVSLGKGIPVHKIQKSHFTEYTGGTLQAAMDHYFPNHILGEGSYGIVYRGLLEGLDVAIKQLKNPDQRAANEEINREIEVQKRCDHQNLVKLFGYSADERSLVYEYLSNGSLEDRLLCMGGSPPLLWPDRCRIAMECAAALQHLHSRTPPIVHRDVKPANVLLDENFVAKLGDVGLARLMEDLPNGNTHIVRKSVIVGTEHYVDPEYLCARRGYLGPKSDVYSFGIVLLQLLVGGIPNLRKIDMAVEREELVGLLDPKAGDWPIALAMDLANLGLWCSEMDRKDRPDLEEEVIPALLEICEAAAMEVMAQEERKRKVQDDERTKNDEALRILEEEKAAVAAKAATEAKEHEARAQQQAQAAAAVATTTATATAAATAAAMAAAATAPPQAQAMSKTAHSTPPPAPAPEAKSGGGCC